MPSCTPRQQRALYINSAREEAEADAMREAWREAEKCQAFDDDYEPGARYW